MASSLYAWKAKVFVSAVVAVIIPAMTSCIYQDQPLSQSREKDDSIPGEWLSQEKTRNPTHIEIASGKNGLYVLTEIEPAKRTDHNCFATLSKKYRYINIEHPTPKQGVDNPQYPRDYITRYIVFRYSVSGDTMTAAPLNHDKFAALIKSNQLEGSASETTWGRTVWIREKASRVLALLEDADNQQYYEEAMTFKRVHKPSVSGAK